MRARLTTERVALTGRRVRLREFSADDLDGVRGIVGDDRVTYYLNINSRNAEQARQLLDGIIERARLCPRSDYYLAVTSLGEDRVVGFTRLLLGDFEAAELRFAIAHDYQRRGYATDAVRTMLDFGFGTLGLHRVTAAVGPENAVSLALVEQLGFTREGVLRDHVFTGGAWRDSILYSVLAQEWRTRG
ncbi:RimJ/RimL family protein N-acetyltransferase [Saccharomonospora amisosensis]|uniref:RimJ/RimL family protein N-acetyltransferase n=1 Tax=Saccharomonospora amisosensis TaxID=1128677 RepID=A0A7X5UVM8_9PSEU|nr:GNAT family protein [Saccharomonospora amisosensis]NIJ14518.1 RimJ/RimL family protein N-acetyltransferase [Saccharomonospora amisosensis]